MTRSPNGSLKDTTVLVVGRGSGLARAIALAALDAGAHVVAAGRDQETLPAAYAGEPGVSTELVDLTDEASIAALGERLGTVDHVVSTASARVRARPTTSLTSAPATPPAGSALQKTSPTASCSP